jgi:tripartite ATP-independent transporter DctM subunit
MVLEWQFILLIIFGCLLFLMATGMPIAFSFLIINLVGVYVFFGGSIGLEQLIRSMYSSLTTFILLPIPLFILMGELMFHSGIAVTVINVIDKWFGRLPGRLGLLAVSAGTIFSALTGASVASVAILGSVLVPEMEKHGYKKPMSLGPILGSGGLAIMIPPSGLAVLLGAIAEISVGKILIAIIVPGLLMAALYAGYIIIRCIIQPSMAPSYVVAQTPLSEKIFDFFKYVLPLGIIVFLVIGVILLGAATPSEAAASGCIGVMIVMFLYRRMSWQALVKSFRGTLNVTGMIFLIIAGASTFSQILSYSGAAAGLAEIVTNLTVAPVIIVIVMQVTVLIMGGFMSLVAIMMITLPIFVPLIVTLGYEPVWFATIFLLNIEMALTTPPLGMNLYVMKAAAPKDTTMGDVVMAALPFLVCDAVAMGLIIAFPQIALWLPSLM